MAHSSLESNVDLFKAFNGATYDNYHKYETHDMNGDGIIDRVECGGGSAGYFVRITDLKTNNRVDLSKPAMSFVHGSLTGWRLVTGCSLVEIKKGHPSVVVSSYKPMSNGARWGVDQ